MAIKPTELETILKLNSIYLFFSISKEILALSPKQPVQKTSLQISDCTFIFTYGSERILPQITKQQSQY